LAQHTVTAYQWTGTYYNATYNTSYTATFEDDDGFLDGNGDADETVSIDGGPYNATGGSPYDIDVSFTDVNGDSHVETFHFFYSDGSWYFIPQPDSAFTEGAKLGTYQSHVTTPTPYDSITCFTRGTLIETDRGLRPVEDLCVGDRVLTADGSFATLALPMRRKVRAREIAANPKLAPVRITAGALGHGLPTRDLLVSRQHRMLVSSKICERMFGEVDVLVAAVRLTELPGIFIEPDLRDVEYFHLAFDRHEVIFAHGAPTESFFPGPEAIRALSDAAREEILTLFPHLTEMDHQIEAARHIPSARHQKSLVARHAKNNRALLCEARC